MKRLSIIFMVIVMAGCGGMRMHRSGDTSGSGAGTSGTSDSYRSGAQYEKSPGERLTDPYDPWFSG